MIIEQRTSSRADERGRRREAGVAPRRQIRVRAVCLSSALFLAGAIGGCDRATPESEEALPVNAAVSFEAVEQALSAADQYLSTGELVKAELILVKLIEKVPRELRARELMGQVLGLKAQELAEGGHEGMAVEAWRQAYGHYQAAVEIDPSSAGLQQSAGVMALAAGERHAGLEHFRTATELDPTNRQHPLYAAQIHIQLEEFDEAEAMLERVLRLDPDEPLAHASMAALALAQDDHAEALRHIAVAREIAPKDLRLRVQEARIHRQAGDPRRALELLTGLSSEQRGGPAVAEEIAASFTALGEHERAAGVWEHLFRSAKEGERDTMAAVRAGEAMLRAGNVDAALVWLRLAQVSGGHAQAVLDLEAEIGRH